MQEFIDIHCHILPYVDDGPTTLEASLELARGLHTSGFSTVIATPHFVDDYSQDYREHIAAQHKLLCVALVRENIPLTVLLGAEIHITPQVIEQARQKTLPVLHTTNYVLLELPFSQPIPSYARQVFYICALHGYQPILAHPERTAVICKDYQLLADNVDNSVLLQINIGSLLGKYGPEAKQAAMRILTEQKAHFLATDSHHSRHIPQLHTFLQQTKYPVSLLLHENPQQMLINRPVINLPKTLTTSYASRLKRLFARKSSEKEENQWNKN